MPQNDHSRHTLSSPILSLTLLPFHTAANGALEVRDDLKSDNLSFTEIAKRVGERWQMLSPEERVPYEGKAASAKEEYLAELAQYKKTQQFREHAQYLVEFKAKHSSEAYGKKPRLDLGRNSSIESRNGSPEPAPCSGVQQRLEEKSFTTVPVHPSRYSVSRAEPTLSTSYGHTSPRPRYSPITSVSSTALTGRAERPSSPSVLPIAWDSPYAIATRDRSLARRPEPLPPITSFEPRDSPVTRGSSFWFDNHLGSILNNTSPLTNYRSSFHPPASFVQQESTSSSNSKSPQSSEPSEPGIWPSGPRDNLKSHRHPRTSLRGSEAPIPLPQAEGSMSRGSSHPLHDGPSLSSLSLHVGLPSQSTKSSQDTSSSRNPVKSQLSTSSQEADSNTEKEKAGLEIRGTLGSEEDPLSVLIQAGKVVEGKSQEVD
ncbi:MAG: hypothetical protein Q9209_001813 [Squamulea sp. 1 TL-2023]